MLNSSQKIIKRDFLSNFDLSKEETIAVFERALVLKASPIKHQFKNQSVALVFQKTSTRTRCSFEAGFAEFGYHPIFIDWNISNFSLADLRDETRVLSQYVSMIVARMDTQADLETMAQNSDVPVVNGMTDRFHPCQALADFLTIIERFGSLKGVKIAYVGDGVNVCHSLIQLCNLLDVPICVAHPLGYAPDEDISETPIKNSILTLTTSPEEAVKGASVVYTDSWVGIGMDESDARLRDFQGYQVTEKLFRMAREDAIFLHCLPAHRGYEVVDGVIDHERSVVFQQAKNRKFAQMALVEQLFSQ